MTLAGGLITVLSTLQLAVAALVLSLGAGGSLLALLLLAWTLLLALLSWRYGRANDRYTDVHRAMTNDLVERMVGHRTRLAQEDLAHRHDEEDVLLERYVRLQAGEDRAESRLSLMPRGWIVVGLAGFVYILMAQQPDTAQLAITLGGILLAAGALTNMTTGMQSVFDVRNAWREVEDLFAAARMDDNAARSTGVELSPSPNGRATSEDAPPLLRADTITFAYAAHV